MRSTQDKWKPRHRRLQFTLRSLLLATAVIALWLGWLTDARRGTQSGAGT